MNARLAFSLLVQQIQATLGATPLSVASRLIGVGWPPETQLADLGRGQAGGPVLVSVFDTGYAKNVTRWNVEPDLPVLVLTHLTSALSSGTLTSGSPVTLTLGGSIVPNDAVALSAFATLPGGGVVQVAGASDTLATLATALAATINGDPTLSALMSAGAVGAVVTLTSRVTQNVVVGTATANLGTVNYEIRRLARRALVTVWTGTAADRETYSNPVATLLGKASSTFGYQDPTSLQWVRVIWEGDRYNDEPVLKDIYRRDFMVTLEYGESYQDFVYPVLIALAGQGLLS